MKVNGPSGIGSAAGPGKAKPASGGGFSLPSTATSSGAAQTAPAAATTSVMSVDAILALQDVGGPLERRRRAVGRASRILDMLEDVKVGLLSGEVAPEHLEKLQAAVRDQRDATDDEKLEGVLNEIETRAAVEMAKLERARRTT
ncbi:MAG: flagellar assembly protein FliX [Phenylobacterium sp.]|uniref:flagellar assembly regulator FliX n=1 Tax=Phenylobacterium sp. TaxID=1871053 RepID=UPI003919AC51